MNLRAMRVIYSKGGLNAYDQLENKLIYLINHNEQL